MTIERLLRPRSIAIVGASDKIGPGFNAWKALEHVGYDGRVFLVNPSRTEMLGQRVYPSLDAIDVSLDAVFIAVRAEAVRELAEQAAAKGAGALAIMSNGFGDAGEAGRRLQAELVDVAQANGLAMCGPNCLGLLNFVGRSALFGTSMPDRVARGGIAAIAQSGSIGIALLNCGRALGFSYLVTSGNEAVTTSADYMEAFIDDPEVRSIIVFAEQIKHPQKFLAMTRRARERDKPVIVLKSGRSERGRAAVLAHTGAVAGSVEAGDAALAAAGAMQVHTLDELIETAALVSQLKRRPSAPDIAAVSLSGGEIALTLDAASASGIDFPPLGEAEAPIAALLPPGSHLANPLDITWAGLYDPQVAQGVARALGAPANVGVVALFQDAPKGLGGQQAARYSNLLRSVARGAEEAGKPFVAVSNLSDEPHPELAKAASEFGVPYLRGTREGLSAIAAYARWATRPAVRPVAPTASEVRTLASARMQPFIGKRLPAEHEARAIFESYGVRGPRERLVQTAADAARAAESIGYPVVVKCLVADVVHKTELGFVKLRLASREAVERAAQDMLDRAARLGGGPVLGLLVQEMVASVAELLVGARVDPEFGPIVVVGSGGVGVELYRDVAVRLAPIDADEALAAIESTKIAKVLAGWRGAPPGDKLAAAHCVSAMSRFIADFAGQISEAEINPLAVLPDGEGCVALDCVIRTNG